MVHIYNCSTGEPRAEGSLKTQGQPRLHSEVTLGTHFFVGWNLFTQYHCVISVKTKGSFKKNNI